MATDKTPELKLLKAKLEQLRAFRELAMPANDVALQEQLEAHGELFEGIIQLVEKITDKKTAEKLVEDSFSTLVDVDESNKPEFWRCFQKSVEIAQDRISDFLAEESPIELVHEKSANFESSFDPNKTKRIFIGHGRSALWRVLKDFLQDTLDLSWEEFNRDTAAGLATTERLSEMLSSACFAFLVMTAEDKHEDGTAHARENVIHEVGLFQGKLGFRKAIILLEEGCEEFSNIKGLTQIRFPRGDVLARSEEIRRVLKREGIMK